MALPDTVCGYLETNIVLNHKESLDLSRMANTVLVAQLATINNSMIHQHGATSDDPGNIAMLQTAANAPRQGMN